MSVLLFSTVNCCQELLNHQSLEKKRTEKESFIFLTILVERDYCFSKILSGFWNPVFTIIISIFQSGEGTIKICCTHLSSILDLFPLSTFNFPYSTIDISGQGKGFDIDLIKLISDAVSIPVIASSGAGTAYHFSEVFAQTNASAALAAGIFHRKEVKLPFFQFLNSYRNHYCCNLYRHSNNSVTFLSWPLCAIYYFINRGWWLYPISSMYYPIWF